MTATPLSAIVRVIDLAGDLELGRTANVFPGTRVKRVLDAAGELEIHLPLWDPVTALVIAAVGGPTYANPPLPYMLEFSFGATADKSKDNSNTIWDSAMWLESATISFTEPGLIINGKDIFDGFNRTYIDRVTFIDVPFGDILYADYGKIKLPPNALMKPGQTFPWQRGLLRSVPCRSSLKGAHRLAFTGDADPHLANLLVTMDDAQDSVARAIKTLLETTAGVYKPNNDPAPFGSRQHYSVDVANRTVKAGYVGLDPKLTLTPADPYTLDETAAAALSINGPQDVFTIAPTNEHIRAQASFLGGSSNHGLPDGARITGMVTINNQRGNAQSTAYPIGWDSSLCLVSISTGNEGGGVFYLVDKTLYPCSQQMDVNALDCPSPAGNIVYAACNDGVRSAAVNEQPQTWGLVGTLRAAISNLHCTTAGVVAIANSAQNGPGLNGVYLNPPIDPDNTSVGWGGWSRPYLGDVVDAFYVDGADPQYGGLGTLLYAPSSAPSTLVQFVIGAGSHVPAPVPKQIDLGANLLGFQGISYTYSGTPLVPRGLLWTAAGGFGVSMINQDLLIGVELIGLGVLSDSFGALAVSHVIAYPPLWSINGIDVTYLAVTDRGLYYATGLIGSTWQPAGGLNSITQASGASVSAGTIQMVLNRTLVRVFVASDRNLFVSNSGGDYFQDVLSQPLDLGPIWYALAQRNGARPFPDNMVGGLATGTATGHTGSVLGGQPATINDPRLLDNGGAGTIWAIAPTDPRAPAKNLVIARRMTERNEFTYRIVDVSSNAPYSQLEPGQLVQMTADDARDAITASDQLLSEHYRFLQLARQPTTVINATSEFWTQEAAIRKTIPGDAQALNFALSMDSPDGSSTVQVCQFNNQLVYVLDWEATLTEGGADVHETLGTIMALANITLAEIVAGVAEGSTRDKRYRGWRVR